MVSDTIMSMKDAYPVLKKYSAFVDRPSCSLHSVILTSDVISIELNVEEVDKYIAVCIKRKNGMITEYYYALRSYDTVAESDHLRTYNIFDVVRDKDPLCDYKGKIYGWYKKKRHSDNDVRTLVDLILSLIVELLIILEAEPKN